MAITVYDESAGAQQRGQGQRSGSDPSKETIIQESFHMTPELSAHLTLVNLLTLNEMILQPHCSRREVSA